MADDPTDTIDVTSFTSQIQSSLASDLLPDLQAVSDLSKQFGENLVAANSSANIDITGFDNIEKMQNSLSASQKSLTHFEGLAKNYRLEMANATDLTEMRVVVADQEAKIAEKIQQAQEITTKLSEETIPDLAKQVEVEQAKLNLIPQGTEAYLVQQQLLQGATEELDAANAGLANNVGVLASMNKYQDEFLQGQYHMINNSADFASAQFDARQSVGGIISETNDLLKVNQQLQEEVQGYGDQMQNFMKNYGPMVDDVMGGFDKIGDSITGTLDQIPLIGGLLSKYASGPLGEAADIAKNAFGGAMKESFKIMQEGGSVTEAIAGGMDSFVSGLQGMGAALSKLLNGPFLLIAAIAGLLYLAFKRFVELDKQAAEFRESLGLMAEHNRHIEKSAHEVSVELAHQGVLLEDAYKAATALHGAFGTTHSVLKEDVAQVSLMGKALGVSEENAAGSLQMFKQMGASSAENARHLQLMTAELASAAGVGADQVMADIAGASEDTMLAMGGMPKQLAIAAVHLRKMGTSLDSMSAAAGKLLDFESSMTAEMKMSSMFGRHISLDKARQLAAAGDMKGLAQEQLRITKEMGGWDQMNRWQKEAAAEALGMSVGDMTKMVQAEKEMELLKTGTAEQQKLYADYQESLAKAENLTTEELAKQAEEKLKAQIQEKKMAEMQAEFNAMMVDLGEKLLPAVEAAMAVIIPILKTVFEWIGYIMVPFEHLGILIGWISDGVAWVNTQLEKVFGKAEDGASAFGAVKAVIGGIIGYFIFFGFLLPKIMGLIGGLGSSIGGMFSTVVEWIKNAAGKIGEAISRVSEGVGNALGSVGEGIGNLVTNISSGVRSLAEAIGKGIKSLFEGIGQGLNSLADFVGNLLTAIGDGIAGLAKGVADALSHLGQAVANVATSIGEGVAGLAKGLGEAIASLAQGIGEGIASILQGVGEGVESLIRSLSNLSVKDMLKAAIGLIALAAALWITAKALQEFGSVSWDAVFKGILILGALSAAAVALGNVGSQILKGAFAVAVLGASLIPAAYAFSLLADVSWGAVWGAIGAIAVLAIVAGILGAPPIIGFVLMGALAIGALGLAMIPFAVAALIAGYAAGLVADAFVKMSGSLSELTLEQVAVIFALGASFAFLGGMLPFIMLGAISLGVIAVALSAFGMAAELVAPGIALLADGFDRMMESLSKITLENVATLALLGATVVGLGLMIVPMILGSIAIGVMAVALGALGLASTIAAPGIEAIAVAMVTLGQSLTHITFESVAALALLGITVAGMGLLFVPLILGSIAIGIMAVALGALGLASTIAAPGIEAIAAAMVTLGESLTHITFESVAALALLGITVAGMGLLFVPLLLGSIAIGIMSVALGALGLASTIAAPGLEAIAGAMTLIGQSLSNITLESVAALALLGITVAGMGLLFVPLLLGSIAIGIVAVALGALGLAATIAAPGIEAMSLAMVSLGESLSHITLESVAALALLGITVAGFAVLLFPMVAGAFVLGIMSGAILGLGLSAMVAAPALDALNVTLSPMIDKMIAISAVAGDLMYAAGAIAAVGGALAMLGIGGAVGEVASSVGSFVGGAIGKVGSMLGFNEDPAEKEDPLDKMIRLGEHGEDLASAADAITRLSGLSGLSASVGEALGSIADGIGDIAWTMLWANDIFSESEGMENLTSLLDTFAGMSANSEGLIAAASGIHAIGEALSSLASGRLSNSIADVADGVTGFFGSLFGGGEQQEVEKLDPMEQFIRIGEVGPDIEKASNALIKLSEVQFDGSGISSLASGLMKFGDAMRAMTGDDSGGGVGGFFSRLFGRKEKKKESPLDKLMTSLGAFADVTKAMGPGAETMANILTGLGTIASDSFVTGMAKATDSIYAFVAALSTIPDHKAEVFAEVASAAISGSEARAVEQSGLAGAGVPVEEMGGLSDGQPQAATVTETLATVTGPTHPPGGDSGIDISGMENNLVELIALMKSGGIAVYLDSKKVSKGLAAAAED